MPTIGEQYWRVARWAGHYRWFSLFMTHIGSRADRALIRATRGRLTISGPHATTMLLTTRGRRSGKDRTVPVYYVRDDTNLVAACENFGLKTASSWPKNLLADPLARIEIGDSAGNYRARLATDDEIARNMPRLLDMWPAHDTYLERSGAHATCSSSNPRIRPDLRLHQTRPDIPRPTRLGSRPLPIFGRIRDRDLP